MNNETLNALMMWGDRANRDTAHLMDIAIAGTIDQLTGHGTVVLRPARLEEIVSRIGPRERDPDGGWVVTLLPEPGKAQDPEPNTEITSAEVATIAGQVLKMEEGHATNISSGAYNRLLRLAKSLAGSALTQRG